MLVTIGTSTHRELVRKCVSAIHSCMLQETGSLKQAGIYPSLSSHDQTTEKSSTKDDSPSLSPSSFDHVLEQLAVLHSQLLSQQFSSSCDSSRLLGDPGKPLTVPYIGPESMKLVLESLCRLFTKKNKRRMNERENLT